MNTGTKSRLGEPGRFGSPAEMLRWAADRFECVYGESPDADFVRAFRREADAIEPETEHVIDPYEVGEIADVEADLERYFSSVAPVVRLVDEKTGRVEGWEVLGRVRIERLTLPVHAGETDDGDHSQAQVRREILDAVKAAYEAGQASGLSPRDAWLQARERVVRLRVRASGGEPGVEEKLQRAVADEKAALVRMQAGASGLREDFLARARAM